MFDPSSRDGLGNFVFLKCSFVARTPSILSNVVSGRLKVLRIHFQILHLKVALRALPSKIILGWKGLTVTSKLAYPFSAKNKSYKIDT